MVARRRGGGGAGFTGAGVVPTDPPTTASAMAQAMAAGPTVL